MQCKCIIMHIDTEELLVYIIRGREGTENVSVGKDLL